MTPALFALLPLVLAPAGGGSPVVTFVDETFDEADWQTVLLVAGGTATYSAVQVQSGNPLPAWEVTHQFLVGTGLFSIWVHHLKTDAVYDPGVQGAIDVVTYSLDSKAVQSSHRLNWALSQGGKIYNTGGPTTTSSSWTTNVSPGFMATDFSERLPDGSSDPGSNPDFSAAGAPITFGFQTHNGGSAGAVRLVEYDNYRVEVNGLASAVAVRLGSPANPNAFLPGATGGPVLGTTWDPLIDHSSFLPGATMDYAVFSSVPGNFVTNHGTFLCDQIEGGQMVVSGTPFAFPVPGDTSFLGATLCLQAASVDPAQGIRLTNALDVTIGSF